MVAGVVVCEEAEVLTIRLASVGMAQLQRDCLRFAGMTTCVPISHRTVRGVMNGDAVNNLL